MTTPVFPSNLVAVGIAKEASYGTPVGPVMLLPSAAPTRDDLVKWQSDGGWRGAPAASFGHVVGALTSSVGVKGPVFADGIGFPLAGILGDVGFTGGSPNVWKFALKNSGDQQPPSYTVTVGDPINQVAYPGCRFTAVQIAATAEDVLTWQGSLVGAAANGTSRYVMPAASGEALLPGWGGTVSIGGQVDQRVLSAQVTLSRPVTPKYNVTGALDPVNQRADVLSVAGQFTIVAASDSYHDAMLAGTVTALDLSFASVSGPARSLELHCSTATLTKVSRTYGTRWVEVTVAVEADANTSDVGASGGQSPILATLKNAVASGTYA